MAALNDMYRFCHLELELSGYNKDVVVLLIFPRVTLDTARLVLALTFSNCSSANFLSCILKPKLGLAMSRQNLTTLSDSSIPRDDTHITYRVVMVTERDIPAAL